MDQDNLRTMVKLAKANNDDIYFNDFAKYLGITDHAFYNFLKGYYDLSEKKAKMLQDVVIDLCE